LTPFSQKKVAAMSHFWSMWRDLKFQITHMDVQEAAIVAGIVVVLGFVCMRGMASKTNF